MGPSGIPIPESEGKMLKRYELSVNIDIMSQPRITASKGRFETSDPRVQRILSGYPGVTLVDERADEPIGVGSSFATVEPVRVTNSGGLQFKEKQPAASARVTKG